MFLVANILRRVSELWRSVKEYQQNLNFFPSVPPSTDEHELRTQRISTRLFVIFFSIALFILLLYTSLVTVTKIVSVDAPSFAQYAHLYAMHSQTLTCPCSNISINYAKIARVEHTLHQVCASIFVNRTWINYLRNLDKSDVLTTDFRFRGPYAFQALKSLCELINQTISDGLTQFYLNHYVRASVVSERVLRSDVESLVAHFRLSTMNTFSLSLSIIRDTTQANALLSALQTNAFLTVDNYEGPFRVNFLTEGDGSCSCVSSPTCIAHSAISAYFDRKLSFNIPGFYLGCYVIEALLQSTLECFYNQPCIDKLQSYISSDTSFNVTALNSSSSTQYSINSTIKELVDKLMIEKWQVSSMFEHYYNTCYPIKCTYTLMTRNDLIYIVTTLFGIAGGLTTILKLALPRLIKLMRRKREQRDQAAEVVVQQYNRHLFQKLKQSLATLNAFPSVPPSTDDDELRTQRLSTRLFIIVFSTALFILILYTSLDTVPKTANIETPSFAQYTHLHSIYSQTLTCPCSKISINYENILRVEYTLHQVCTSIYVDQTWIDDLGKLLYEVQLSVKDFRRISPYAFQALRTFCRLVNRTISDSRTQFYANQYVSASVVSERVLKSEVQSLVGAFQSSIINSFSLSRLMIREITQANALLSALYTNYQIALTKDRRTVDTSGAIYYNCSCRISSNCIIQSRFDNRDPTLLFLVPGFYTGCYVVESLLQSTLECFYNLSCIDTLKSHISSNVSTNMRALNASSTSLYPIHSNIEEMVNKLMIEEWKISSMFEQYYNECHPTQCTYTFKRKNDLIYIVTTLFGIAGGLTTVLKFVVPRMIKLIRRKRRQQQQPIVMNNQRGVGTIWKEYFQNLNFFASVPPSTDERELHHQRISTRLFLFLLISSMAILLLYNSFISMTNTVNAKEPSFAKYRRLYASYSDTLQCPCSKLSISYEKILHVEYKFHQVCRSIFVNHTWIDYLGRGIPMEYFETDFRFTSRYTFLALKALCDLINRTTSDSVARFYAYQYISASAKSQPMFESEIDLLVHRFRSSVADTFKLSLRLIRNTTEANALFSALQSNYITVLAPNRYNLNMETMGYDGCECDRTSQCVAQSCIYNFPRFTSLFDIPGFYMGCYTIEALLRSNLQCFYNQTCIDILRSYISSDTSFNATALNASSSIQYAINSTIEELVDKLMIEEWHVSTMFEQYYNQCYPTQCTYTLTTRNDLIYIATTLFGIAGGLSTVLKLLVPRLVKSVVYCIRKWGTTVAPAPLTIQ